MTYEGCVDLELIEDPFERFATEQQINEFGQTPRQLFRYDHPQKFSTKPIVKSLFINHDEIVENMVLPNKISLDVEEEVKNYEPVIVEKYKEIGITDIDYQPKKRNINANSNIPVADAKSAPKEELKHEVFEDDNQDQDSFLKRLKYKNMESMGLVHNDEIMEVNAITNKSGETNLMIVSKDGLIKLFQEERTSDKIEERYAQKRSFYVSEQGILCSCVLNSQESVVIGTADNNIILFNFSTGTEIGNFYAHDSDIINISILGGNLISFSVDTTMKIWNMLNSDFSHPKVYYDHEDEILSADVCQKSIISIDANGIILLRDITRPGEIQKKIEVNLKDNDFLEHAIIKFNKADSYTFFLVIKDSFYIYETNNGSIINELSLEEGLEIDLVFQHKD